MAIAVQKYRKKDDFDLPTAIKLRFVNRLSLNEIADHFNVPKATVFDRLSKITNLLPDPEEIQAYVDHKSKMLDALEYKTYINMLDEQKLKDASFNNLAYGFQNICTQNRLEKGLATQIVDTVAIVGTIDDLRRREDEILKTVQARIVQDVVPNKDNVK